MSDEKLEQLSLKENRDNLFVINKYCRKVLRYFHNDIWGTSWLEAYKKNGSPSWGVSVTDAGRIASLTDFIQYVKSII